MTHSLKALSLALIATIALGALMASAAQAQGKFTSLEAQELTLEQDQGQLENTGWQYFTTSSGTVICRKVSGFAPALVPNSTYTSLSSEIGYQQCTGPFGEAVTVATNECWLQFTFGTTIGQTTETTGQAHINCPQFKQITIQSPLCQIHIPKQTPTGGHVVYHTVAGPPKDVTLEVTLSGIQYQGTGFCASGNNGTYSGNITAKGYKQIGVHDAQQLTAIEVH